MFVCVSIEERERERKRKKESNMDMSLRLMTLGEVPLRNCELPIKIRMFSFTRTAQPIYLCIKH